MNKKSNNRILLVDNEPDIALAFKIGLEDNGFVVDTFNDPQIASANFKDGLYDLLLLDIKMPKMTGIEFYQRMKEIDKKVKVCFITASEIYYHEKITKELLPKLGVRRLIRKPIKIEDLVKDLKQELEFVNNNNDHNNSSNNP
jgi:two-component system catabolic regulation response regulator CreB/two-component system response regulator ChvI